MRTSSTDTYSTVGRTHQTGRFVVAENPINTLLTAIVVCTVSTPYNAIPTGIVSSVGRIRTSATVVVYRLCIDGTICYAFAIKKVLKEARLAGLTDTRIVATRTEWITIQTFTIGIVTAARTNALAKVRGRHVGALGDAGAAQNVELLPRRTARAGLVVFAGRAGCITGQAVKRTNVI